MATDADIGTGGGAFDVASFAVAPAFGATSPGGSDSGNSDSAGQRDSAGTEFDARIHSGSKRADGTWRNKRGSGGRTAAPGGNPRKKGRVPPSVNVIENALTGIHGMLALGLKAPEMMLEPDESRPLAEAVAEVAKHYDIPGLDEKAMAWVGLAMVAGKIYVPRAIAISQRTKTSKAPRRTATVTPLRPVDTEKPPVVPMGDFDPASLTPNDFLGG